MEWCGLIIDVSTCRSKGTVCCMKLWNKGWWNRIEECVPCNKEILSVVNKLNGREIKMRESHGVASGNGGKEVGVKFKRDSD